MSLRLMLDENISPVVAEQIRQKQPDILIESVNTWHGGAYTGTPDVDLIAALDAEEWLLVTYDTQILAEQPFMFDGSMTHSGILFVDHHTIAQNGFGGLVRALISFWETNKEQVWKDRIGYLSRSE